MSYIPFPFPYSSIRCLPMDSVSHEHLSKSLTAAPLPVSLLVMYSTVLILCFYVDVDESCPFCHSPNYIFTLKLLQFTRVLSSSLLHIYKSTVRFQKRMNHLTSGYE